MSLKLYYDMLSQPSRVVLIFLRANEINFEECPINLTTREHMEEPFVKLNPLKKVPLLVDKDFKLGESIAILRYLCREKKVADSWYPKASHQQARVDEFLEYHHIELRIPCVMLFHINITYPFWFGKNADQKTKELHEKRMYEAVDKIEQKWLNNSLFLVGNNITIADLLGACEIEQVLSLNYDVRQGRPKLSAWLDRLKSQLSPHYEQAHRLLYETMANFTSQSKY